LLRTRATFWNRSLTLLRLQASGATIFDLAFLIEITISARVKGLISRLVI
jgi:hypothetical protein